MRKRQFFFSGGSRATRYERYFSGARLVHFLLGPATVALAVPLARQLPRMRRSIVPLVCVLVAGCVLVIGTGIFGAVTARFLFNALRIDSRAARAFQVSLEMGGFAGLGMGLNGVLTALLAPWLVPVLLRLPGWPGRRYLHACVQTRDSCLIN